MPSAVRALLRAWYAFRLLRLRDHRRPHDTPDIRSGDPRADRVLLVGTGITHGWGVDSHHDGVVGRLSVELAARTGRGADVELVGSEAMNISSTLAWVGDRDLSDVDALVLALGFNDALRRTPPDVWESGLRAVIAALVARLRPEATVVLLAAPPVDAIRVWDGPVARTARTHRERLDAASEAVAAQYGLQVLRPAAFGLHGRERLSPAALYARLGSDLAELLAPLLLAARPQATERAPHPEPVWEWSGTAELVALAAKGGAPRLRKLATAARKRFRVELAVVSLKNGDRLYYANDTDVMPAVVPLDLAFCRHTIESESSVVVPDAQKDERFAGNPMLDLSFINFYAGYPLRSSSGEVIGSFCLQGSRPRRAGRVPVDTLRAFALEAEAELQRFEKSVEVAAR